MGLCFESHTFDWRPNFPLVVTAKRYWDPTSAREDGYTCILTHGTGFHGEQWEPTLNHLISQSKDSRDFPIREAWSVDCPNHGEAAVINEKALLRGGFELVFPWTEYVYALYLFLNHNGKVHFADRKLIGIAHSMGAVCLCLTQTYPHCTTFEQLILCEPMMAPSEIPSGDPMLNISNILISATEARRDTWPDREDAFEKLKTRKTFAVWDEEVLRIFVNEGLRDLPTATYPGKEGVTLKCTKVQEVACYRDSMSSRRAFEFLPALCSRLPVHVIWGEIDDALVTEIKRRVTDAASGRKMASVSRVRGAGHLIVQVAPKRLASAIFAAVTQTSATRGKL
ncbi:hypothetical protein K439DRAFT_1352898 [Ramaria rubella]|nr:hypothetical protein K439DRAFT_1352898 [Ramaria rubella]